MATLRERFKAVGDRFFGGDDSVDYKKAERAAGMSRNAQRARSYDYAKEYLRRGADELRRRAKNVTLGGAVRGVAGTVGRMALPAGLAYGLAKAGEMVAEGISDNDQMDALESYNTEEDRKAFRDAQRGLRAPINPTARESIPEGYTPSAPTRYTSASRPTPNEEVGAPDAIDKNGEPFYAGPTLRDNSYPRVEAPTGRTDSGVEIFQDQPKAGERAAFSDRGRGGFGQPADLGERLASLDRQYRTLRDQNRAREEGFSDVEDYKAAELQRNVEGLARSGAGDQAIAEYVAQQSSGGGGTLRDRIALADFERKVGNDAFNREARAAELGLRAQDADRLAANSSREGTEASRRNFEGVQSLITSDTPGDRELGLAQARDMILNDPNLERPETRSLLTWAVGQGETSTLDWLLNLGSEAPVPATPGGLRDFSIEGNELKKSGNNYVGRTYSPELMKLLESFYNAQSGLR